MLPVAAKALAVPAAALVFMVSSINAPLQFDEGYQLQVQMDKDKYHKHNCWDYVGPEEENIMAARARHINLAAKETRAALSAQSAPEASVFIAGSKHMARMWLRCARELRKAQIFRWLP